MNAFKKSILIVSLLGVVIAAQAQSKKRLQPGKLYEAGEHIIAPRYGFNSVVPAGWEGTLPRDTEIFLLMPNSIEVGGELFTFVNDKKDLESIKAGWVKGANLSETIMIKSKGDIAQQGDMISSEVTAAGEHINKGYKGFIAARCNPHGPCVTCLAIGPVQFYDQMKTAVTSFMTQATFTEPSNVSIYADFDWKEFLSGKTLITLAGVESAYESGTKESMFHLCSDGKFTSNIKKKGMMKQMDPQYKGSQSGTWSTESIGDHGVLKLKFNKLPEVDVPLYIHDEKIYVNEERYFAATSDKCK